MGYDADGTPRLFQTEPSGNYTEWKAVAIGRNMKTVKEYLEKNYDEETSLDGVKLACRSLLEVVEAGGKNIEVAVLRPGQPLQLVSDEEIDHVVAKIEEEKEAAEAAKRPAPPS